MSLCEELPWSGSVSASFVPGAARPGYSAAFALAPRAEVPHTGSDRIELLQRDQGAKLEELIAATGWLPAYRARCADRPSPSRLMAVAGSEATIEAVREDDQCRAEYVENSPARRQPQSDACSARSKCRRASACRCMSTKTTTSCSTFLTGSWPWSAPRGKSRRLCEAASRRPAWLTQRGGRPCPHARRAGSRPPDSGDAPPFRPCWASGPARAR